MPEKASERGADLPHGKRLVVLVLRHGIALEREMAEVRELLERKEGSKRGNEVVGQDCTGRQLAANSRPGA